MITKLIRNIYAKLKMKTKRLFIPHVLEEPDTWHLTRLLKDKYCVQELIISPRYTSKLYYKSQESGELTVSFFVDDVIGIDVLKNQSWDYALIEKFEKLIVNKNLTNVNLIDVGANIGLFSRQLKIALGERLCHIELFEPSLSNYLLLMRNLHGIPHSRIHNYALGDQDQRLELHKDRTNTGNYSLLDQAIPENCLSKTEHVVVRNASQVFTEIMARVDGCFVYKSDTQGYDQKIASTIPLEFWDKVEVAIFELWRMPMNHYDVAAFRNVLSTFNYLAFGDDLDKILQTEDVIDYLEGDDGDQNDLFAWR